MEPAGEMAYTLLHVGNHILDIGNSLACLLILLGRIHHCQLDLLILELKLRAIDGLLELCGSLVAEALVDLLRRSRVTATVLFT